MNPIDDFLSTLASPRTAPRYGAALEEFTAWYRRTNHLIVRFVAHFL
ncbi:MAG: hypothetical protein ACOYXO_16070 [Chloroflexota bacterium]